MFYLTTHSTHFMYSYMAKDHWIAREETRCHDFIGYSIWLVARDILYTPIISSIRCCYSKRVAPIEEAGFLSLAICVTLYLNNNLTVSKMC